MRLPRPKIWFVVGVLLTALGAAAVPVYLELNRLEELENLVERRRELLARREQLWREHENHRSFLNQTIEQNRIQINIANKSVGTFIADTAGREKMISSAQTALRSLWHTQKTIKQELSPENMRQVQFEWSTLSKQFTLLGDDARVSQKRQNRAIHALVPRMAESRETMSGLVRQQNILFEEQDRVWKILQEQEVGYMHRLEAELVLLDGFEKKLVSIMP